MTYRPEFHEVARRVLGAPCPDDAPCPEEKLTEEQNEVISAEEHLDNCRSCYAERMTDAMLQAVLAKATMLSVIDTEGRWQGIMVIKVEDITSEGR